MVTCVVTSATCAATRRCAAHHARMHVIPPLAKRTFMLRRTTIGSNVEPKLPACAAASMPQLRLDSSPPDVHTAHPVYDGGPVHQGATLPQAVVVSLAVLLPAVAVAALGGGGWAMWRRRRRAAHGERSRHELLSIKRLGQRQRPDGTAAAAAAAAAGAAEEGAAARQRRSTTKARRQPGTAALGARGWRP